MLAALFFGAVALTDKKNQRMEKGTLHAGCISSHGRGVLILGASGSGKSALALRMIAEDSFQATMLVSDDRSIIERRGAVLFAKPAPALAGRIEVRNVGIAKLPYRLEVPLHLAVTLLLPEDAQSAAPRLPEKKTLLFERIPLPHHSLKARDPDLTQKIRRILSSLPPRSCGRSKERAKSPHKKGKKI